MPDKSCVETKLLSVPFAAKCWDWVSGIGRRNIPNECRRTDRRNRDYWALLGRIRETCIFSPSSRKLKLPIVLGLFLFWQAVNRNLGDATSEFALCLRRSIVFVWSRHSAAVTASRSAPVLAVPDSHREQVRAHRLSLVRMSPYSTTRQRTQDKIGTDRIVPNFRFHQLSWLGNAGTNRGITGADAGGARCRLAAYGLTSPDPDLCGCDQVTGQLNGRAAKTHIAAVLGATMPDRLMDPASWVPQSS